MPFKVINFTPFTLTTPHIMKKITTLLAFFVGVTLNAQFAQGSGGLGSNKASSATAASGSHSTAMGYNTTASGYASTAMGSSTTASGGYSTTMGQYTSATVDYSAALGYGSSATGISSTAMGHYSASSGAASVAMGAWTTASGDYSIAMGWRTIASDYGSLSIGSFNSVNSIETTVGGAGAFNLANAAFVIGNGTASNAKSDAFVVYSNGNATLAGDLTINSDARLKDNIQPLGSTLDKLHQIEGKTYTFLKDEEHTPKIGVLAQEVQAVFPELVTEGADGILSVNYQGLVPVLINAINEQDAKIAALEVQNAEIKELKEMVRVLSLQQSQANSSVASN